MKPIILKKPTEFAVEFVQRYCGNGFGSLSKRDIDLLVLELLEKHEGFSGLSNHAVAQKLGVSEMRLRTLRYELAQRIYSDNERYFPERLLVYLNKAEFVVERESGKTKVAFAIEDTFVRLALAAQLKETGGFSDGSFNSEIMRVDLGRLCAVLEHIYPDDKCKKVLKAIRDGKKELDSDKRTELWKEFLKGAANKIGEVTVGLGVAYLQDSLTK
jgi:hypothetical protein